MPRFDASSTFGRILDEGAGHWSIEPSLPVRSRSRCYVGRSLVLRTTFETEDGTLELTDALAVGEGEETHEIGSRSPRLLVRRLRCTEGRVPVRMELAARPEYGRIVPLLRFRDGRGILGTGGASAYALSYAVPAWIESGSVHSRFVLEEGEERHFGLQHRWSWEERPTATSQQALADALELTVRRWAEWSEEHQNYEGAYAELVQASGRILRGLTYAPTGAIVAAPTTSLPEDPGGVRNWDYRFTWVRDASLTMHALWVAACPTDAGQFFDYLAGCAFTQLRRDLDLHIVFGIGGEHDLSERELWHLRGYAGAKPVRVGNDAWRQRQTDAYGSILDAAVRLQGQLGHLDSATREFLVELANAAALRWREPDQGIWEVRDVPRHYVHSKVMCWVALDRAIRMAELIGGEAWVARWAEERDELRKEILVRGFDPRRGAFIQHYDTDALDASLLVIPLVGFLPADDPRVLSTIDAIEGELLDRRGLVCRYRADDNLPGTEGTFLLCTFWLAQVQAIAGRAKEAEATFRRAIAYQNDLGLLAEEVDSESGELLGNFPQAFSHIGLIEAAFAIDEAFARTDGLGAPEEVDLPGLWG